MNAHSFQQSVGLVAPQVADFESPIQLACGVSLSSWRLSYETYGVANADKSNAVLICHALSGSQHAAGRRVDDEKNIGWWDNFIGPGKPIDTDIFYVVSANNLGGCHGSTGPASPHPADGRPYGSRFPVVTVEDWVHSQKILAKHLGIKKFVAVVGGSLGGMQAMRWAIDYPQSLQAAVVIAATAKLTAINIAFNDIARQAIISDEHFYRGDFYARNESPKRGLGVARMLGHVTYLSDVAMAKKFGRLRREEKNRFDYGSEFEVESYLRYQGDKFSSHFDANTYLLMTRALDYFDPAADAGGDLAAALSPVAAEFLLLSFSSDWRFSPAHSREIAKALLAADKKVSYLEVESRDGHDSFLLAEPLYHRAVTAFMQRLAGDNLLTKNSAVNESENDCAKKDSVVNESENDCAADDSVASESKTDSAKKDSAVNESTNDSAKNSAVNESENNSAKKDSVVNESKTDSAKNNFSKTAAKQ